MATIASNSASPMSHAPESASAPKKTGVAIKIAKFVVVGIGSKVAAVAIAYSLNPHNHVMAFGLAAGFMVCFFGAKLLYRLKFKSAAVATSESS